MTLFASVAAVALIGMVLLAEFSIRQHRAHTLEAVARAGVRHVLSQPLDERRAMLTADEETFAAFAKKLMADPSVLSVRLGSDSHSESWIVTRDSLPKDPRSFPVHVIQSGGYRLVERGKGRTTEISIPISQLVLLNRPKFDEIRAPDGFASTLWISLDATEADDAARAGARETRDAQAIVAALVLLGLWILTRRAIRPIELLVDNAETIANRRDPGEAPACNSAEARRLQHALTILAIHGNRSTSTLLARNYDSEPRPTVEARARESRIRSNNYSALQPVESSANQQSAAGRSIRDRDYRILLVEDNPVNRTVAIDMLERIGCTVEAARDGVECISLFDPESFDLVFMDIRMPKMDGLEATRKIRAMETESGFAPTPIIALTAHSEPSDRTACQRVGMNGHIGKPFRAVDLEQALLEWGEAKKSPEASP